MSTAAGIFTPIFAVLWLIGAFQVGRRLRGEGIWRWMGVMACLMAALKAPQTAIGLFG